MFYLLWAIVNIAALVFIILVAVKTFKLIKERVGLAAAIVFVVGIISLIGLENGNSEPKNDRDASASNFNKIESIESYSLKHTTIVLANNLISKYGLAIHYGKSKEDQTNMPISAFSFTNGLSSGTKWIPASAVVNTTDDNKKFQYDVYGTIEWRLMGFLIYSQSKTFSGTAIVK